MTDDSTAQNVLNFWFSEAAQKHWFKRSRNALVSGQVALALILLLDQCSRNLNRGSSAAFANDAHARSIVRDAIARGLDQQLQDWHRGFLYMPLMHSESLEDQDDSVRLFAESGLDNTRYALEHRDLIRRFGRFPHRNEVMGRTSTAEEIAYLQSEGAFHG